MEISMADQIALDDALVAPANRLKIGKCNLRLSSDVTSKEATLQVVYDVLKLTPFYKAFQVTADAPEIYMQEFWASAYVHNRSVRFKMNNKKHIIGLDQFRDILQICPKVGNKKFEEPPLEKEILAFLASLGHSGEIRKITDVNVNKLHQPWRSFAAIINKCLSGKPSYDSLRLSQAQILWGMYNKKNVDYAYLLWEDFIFQIENKNTKKGNAMYYPRFTKLVVNFVMDKDPSIPRRNKVNWHYARDDPMFTTINVISRNEDTQLYGTILPVALTNEDIRNSESYKEYYAIASGTIPPKIKGSKKKADTDTTTKQKPPTVPKEKKEKKSGKGKQKTTDDDDQDDEKAQDDENEDQNDVNETTKDDEDDDVHDDDENTQDDDDEAQTEKIAEYKWTLMWILRYIIPFQDDDEHDVDEKVQEDDDEEQTESDADGDDFVIHRSQIMMIEIIQKRLLMKMISKYIHHQMKKISDEKANKKRIKENEAQSKIQKDLDGRDEVMTGSTIELVSVYLDSIWMHLHCTINSPSNTYPLVIQTQQLTILSRLKALEDNFSELRQTNQYAEALSSIPSTVDQYLANKNAGSKWKNRTEKDLNWTDVANNLSTDFVMSDLEDSTVTYTEVSSLFEDLSDIGSPRVDGLPMMPEDPYAYVEAALQDPPSPNYVLGPKEPEHAPPSPDFVPDPVYPEFMPLEDDVLTAEEQPLPAAVSPTADSPGDEDQRIGRRRGTSSGRLCPTTAMSSTAKMVLDIRSKRAHLYLDLLEVLGQTMVLFFTLDAEIRRDPKRYVGYGITDTWDEILDTDEIYKRLDEAQDARAVLSGRLNLLQRNRRSHAYIALLIEREARLSRDA
ncbi:hypothetical protein Tco_1033024 [Tanacetum coccineum]|uniref:Uncharacterized protein n=1 Tax=Tanacetum coccineum TaxID=301880 RepID=A0ABQ5GDH9_9ASTR